MRGTRADSRAACRRGLTHRGGERPMAGRRSRPLRPDVYHGGVALAAGLLGAAALVLLFRPAPGWAPYLGAWLVSVNVVAFGYYGYDKGQARRSSRRVPEAVLHGLAF